jgi:hypothetical protein
MKSLSVELNRIAQLHFTLHFMIGAMLIVEDHTETVKCRTAMKELFLYFNLCISEQQ